MSKYKKPDFVALKRKKIKNIIINVILSVVVTITCSQVYSGSQIGKKACFELGKKAGNILFWNIGYLEKVGFYQACKEHTSLTIMKKSEYLELLHGLREYGYLEK